MNSIRGTILVWFLALEVLALVGVSWYVYHMTERVLAEKEVGIRHLMESRYEARCQAQRDRFDEELLRRVQRVASRTRLQTGGRNAYLHPLGQLSESVFVQSPVTLLVYSSFPSILISRALFGTTEISIPDAVLPRPSDGQDTDHEYCQIWSTRGRLLIRSPTLGERTLPLDPRLRSSLERFEWSIDDLAMPDGKTVRCVTYRSNFSGSTFTYPVFNFRRGRIGPPPVMSRESPANDGSFFSLRQEDREYPTIIVQYASDTDRLKHVLAGYRQELLNDWDNLRVQNAGTLQTLWTQLWLMSLVAFGLTGVGGAWLIYRGMRPLSNLAESVSRVSYKNFNLGVVPANLPHELRPIAEKLQETLTSLERAFIHEKRAAADISHELRTPIASLLATIQVALRKPRPTEEYRETLATCAETGRHLNHLVERLLKLSKLDAGVTPLENEELELTDIVDEVVAMVRPLADAKGVTLTTTPGPECLFHADGGKLKEILLNLIGNAVQYNRANGKVEVRWGHGDKAVWFEVADNGPGIAAAAMPFLFDRFYRADPSRQTNTVNAGLGLSIVKGYLDLMGGTIRVTSKEGAGATFRVEIPLVPVDAPTSSKTPTRAA